LSKKTLERCNIGVNSRVISQCGTESEGHNADKLVANNQRATRIILARVFISTRHSSTDHVHSDSTVSGIRTIAFCTGCDVYLTAWSCYGYMPLSEERIPQPLTTERAPAGGSEEVSEIG